VRTPLAGLSQQQPGCAHRDQPRHPQSRRYHGSVEDAPSWVNYGDPPCRFPIDGVPDGAHRHSRRDRPAPCARPTVLITAAIVPPSARPIQPERRSDVCDATHAPGLCLICRWRTAPEPISPHLRPRLQTRLPGLNISPTVPGQASHLGILTDHHVTSLEPWQTGRAESSNPRVTLMYEEWPAPPCGVWPDPCKPSALVWLASCVCRLRVR
jgi:hypothetical protein